MKVNIDKNICIGCGTCNVIAPNTFGMNDNEGKAYVKNQEVDNNETLQDAIDSCPVMCIHEGEGSSQ